MIRPNVSQLESGSLHLPDLDDVYWVSIDIRSETNTELDYVTLHAGKPF